MELFVCSTNYQLLNAILIVREYKLEADLLVTREAIWSGCNLDILITEKVFKNIYKWTYLAERLSDDRINSFTDRWIIQTKKALSYTNKRKIWNSIPNRRVLYSKVHIAYMDSITLWIYSAFRRKGAVLSLFEDGTYSYGCLSVRRSFVKRMLEIILYNTRGIDECVQMYIKHPEKVNLGTHQNTVLLKIPERIGKEITEAILLPLYKTEEGAISQFEKKIIVFDHNLELNLIKAKQREIAEKTINVFGAENVIVKLHPSSKAVEYGDNIVTFQEKVPFEVIMALMNMNNKVLISIFSTACLSPKRDYDQEPYVIFTYKLYADSFSIDNKYLTQIDQLNLSYNKKNRVFVPRDIMEYLAILKNIKGEIE